MKHIWSQLLVKHKHSQILMRFKEKKNVWFKERKKPKPALKESVCTGRNFFLSLFIPIIGCDFPGILVFSPFIYYYK